MRASDLTHRIRQKTEIQIFTFVENFEKIIISNLHRPFYSDPFTSLQLFPFEKIGLRTGILTLFLLLFGQCRIVGFVPFWNV